MCDHKLSIRKAFQFVLLHSYQMDLYKFGHFKWHNLCESNDNRGHIQPNGNYLAQNQTSCKSHTCRDCRNHFCLRKFHKCNHQLEAGFGMLCFCIS
uniref:Uncharacterized protein n=1 Tax=Rhizophora mucronata TaxID=61149 RepID=A0A2P2QNL6_RHIMU